MKYFSKGSRLFTVHVMINMSYASRLSLQLLHFVYLIRACATTSGPYFMCDAIANYYVPRLNINISGVVVVTCFEINSVVLRYRTPAPITQIP